MILLILIWYIFTNSSEPSEEYVTFYKDENTIHKCKRENYNEMIELLEITDQTDMQFFISFDDLTKEEINSTFIVQLEKIRINRNK